MDNTPSGKIVEIKRKVYTTPELVVYGDLTDITQASPFSGGVDILNAEDPGSESG